MDEIYSPEGFNNIPKGFTVVEYEIDLKHRSLTITFKSDTGCDNLRIARSTRDNSYCSDLDKTNDENKLTKDLYNV